MSRSKATGKQNTMSAEAPRLSIWAHIGHALLMMFSIIAVLVLVATCYAGYLSPLHYGGKVGILPLCVPFALAAVVLLIAVSAFSWRRPLWVLLLGIVVCGGPLLTYFPLHILSPKVPADAERFTLTTYNVLNFVPRDTSLTQNGMVDYILSVQSDIVCIQEDVHFNNLSKSRISREQLDSLHAIYPHIHTNGHAQMVMSKFPVQPLHFEVSKNSFPAGDLAAYRVTLPSGKMVTIFNVHLASFNLDQADKELYHNLTELQRENFSDVRHQLLSKLSLAATTRARQVNQLVRWIRQYGGPDVIVCGDFNDVQGCYTIRTLEDHGFKDFYPEVGFGPMVTFNDDRFYFCIDHILFRGSLRPLWLRKGTTKASDHYPLTVEFYIAPTEE